MVCGGWLQPVLSGTTSHGACKRPDCRAPSVVRHKFARGVAPQGSEQPSCDHLAVLDHPPRDASWQEDAAESSMVVLECGENREWHFRVVTGPGSAQGVRESPLSDPKFVESQWAT